MVRRLNYSSANQAAAKKIDSRSKKFLGIISIIFTLYPYVSFGLTDYDTQPWYILFCSIFVLAHFRRVLNFKNTLLLCMFPSFIALCIGLLLGDDQRDIVRAVVSYFGFGIAYCTFYLYKTIYGSFRFIVAISLLSWIGAGLIQTGTSPYVLEPLVMVRTSDLRGVTGLATEASFYAIILLMLTVVLLLEGYGKKKIVRYGLFAFSLLWVVVVIKSAIGVLIFPFCIGLVILQQRLGVRAIVGLSVFILLGFAMVSTMITSVANSRLAMILPQLIENPLYFMTVDISAGSRVAHIFYSYYFHFSSFLMPHGFNSFSGEAYAAGVRFTEFYVLEFNNKIMSGLGASAYELGFFAYSIFYLVWWSSLQGRSFSDGRLETILNFVCLSTIMSMAIPLSMPIFPMLLVSCRFASNPPQSRR